jgi:hypothetical protein
MLHRSSIVMHLYYTYVGYIGPVTNNITLWLSRTIILCCQVQQYYYGCTLWLTYATPQHHGCRVQHDLMLVKNDIALWFSCTPLHCSQHVPVSNSPRTTLYCNCQEQHYTKWLTLWLSFLTLHCRL